LSKTDSGISLNKYDESDNMLNNNIE